jgi:hypothetical protein
MGEAMGHHGMEAGIGGQDLEGIAGGGIAVEDTNNVLSEPCKHWSAPNTESFR